MSDWRDDAIEAGAKALDAKWGDVVWAMVVDEATTVVDAVEPIIRADERERHGNNCRGMWDEWVHDLRAQVEALPSAQIVAGVWNCEPPHDVEWDGPVVFLSDVIALLGGESDE